MSDLSAELTPWLTLLRVPGVGPVEFLRLLEDRGDIHRALDSALKKFAAKPAPDPTEVKRDLAWANSPDNHVVLWTDEHYPAMLREIPDPPPLFFAVGNVATLMRPQLAVVGSRKATPYGRDCARTLANAMAQRGWVITSGLALGIDGIAHQAAVDGNFPTVSVEATGLDRVYPRAHHSLAHAIVSGGGVRVSEFPPGTEPMKTHFPRRNRIISGLSHGTLVVEADLKSGSLITARTAAHQGREVFAVPGPIFSAGARGCHYLIKQGAKLVEAADDISEEIGILLQAPRSNEAGNEIPTDAPDLCGKHELVFNQLGYEPTPVDSLAERTNLSAQDVAAVLIDLEIQGVVTVMPGGLYTRQALREAKR